MAQSACYAKPRTNSIRLQVRISLIQSGLRESSDFDGGTTTRFDTSELVYITQALLNAGYSESEIRGIMGENVLRVLGQVLP